MLTVDFDRLRVRPGDVVLDVGCGAGRHAVEAVRRGARVVALDRSVAETQAARRACEGLAELLGEAPPGTVLTVGGDATRLPLPDGCVDRVVASEVLEHLPDDAAALAEIARVLRPGGRAAVTVPRWLPERVCWALSDEYHANDGGHLRIYRGDALRSALAGAGLRVADSHHAHALHAPYWWLKCAVGPSRDHPATRLYHRLLVWDLMRRPHPTRLLERLLDPLIGKSLVLYADRPALVETSRAAA